jgi:hypothetical protein
LKKILLASGCSFTDPNYISNTDPEADTSWPKWPELLAKKLDMDYINLGLGGAGNEYIYSSLLEQILKTKDKSQIGLVIPAWTQCQRKDWQINKKGIWRNNRYEYWGDIFSWLKKSLRYMISLQTICERFNIPLKQFQMIDFYEQWLVGLLKTDWERMKNKNDPNFKDRMEYPGLNVKEDRLRCKQIMMEYDPYINTKDFIGWPIVSELGGYFIEEKTTRHFPNGAHIKDFIISNGPPFYDMHPNAKGQQKIAEFLYDRLG